MTTTETSSVYVGSYGAWPVPADILAKAAAMNAGKSLGDRRTRGARLIDWWGRSRDGEAETILMLRKKSLT